jgi:hypothetical protein
MDLLPWFPALTTSALLAAALWFGRNLISTRLTKSVEHEFNAKLEILRAQVRESEERLKAELRVKEAEIAALRSGALTALASRQMAVDKRRLEAVDQLWAAVTALGPARGLAAMMSVIKFEAAAPRAERDPKFRQFFEMIGTGFDAKHLDLSGAAKARPFLSPMVWAIYSAFLAITMHAVMRWHVLKGGLGSNDLTDNEAAAKLIKIALPDYSDYVDKQGPSGYYYLLDALESRLLTELENMLTGVEADKANIEQAAEILRQANELLKQTNRGQTTA